MNIPGITDGLKTDGGILLNSSQQRDNDSNGKLVRLPATQLAQQYLGRPVPNTALLSAFLKLTDLLPQQSLIQSLQERFKGAVLEKNIALIEATAATITESPWKMTTNA